MKLDSNQIEILISPSVEGALSKVARPPILKAQGIRADLSGHQVEAEVDANSLRVHSPELSEADRSKIHQAVWQKILEVDRFPKIAFHGSFQPSEAHTKIVTIQGSLTLHGVTREIELPFQRGVNDQFLATFRLRQSDYRIPLLSAFMGALKATDLLEMTIRVSVPTSLTASP